MCKLVPKMGAKGSGVRVKDGGEREEVYMLGGAEWHV